MKEILFIRPKYDDFTESSFFASQSILQAAQGTWTITDRSEKKANKRDVQSALTAGIDFVIHYGHGDKDAIVGQHKSNPKRERVIENRDLARLKGKAVSTVSCYTTQELGPKAINAGARAYLGYATHIGFVPNTNHFFNDFVEAFNAANIELLNGKTFKEAYDKGLDTLKKKFALIYNAPDTDTDKYYAELAMTSNVLGIQLLGDPDAVATHSTVP